VRTQILTNNNWPKIIFMASQFLFQESADGLSEIITNSPLGSHCKSLKFFKQIAKLKLLLTIISQNSFVNRLYIYIYI